MTTIATHTCPHCALRFTVLGELDDHVRREHTPMAAEPPPLRGRVCVPVDPTQPGSTALAVAATVARQAGMAVEVVAVPPSGLGHHTTNAHLTARVRTAERTGATATAQLLCPGDVAAALLAHLAHDDVAVACMDSRSRGPVGELVLGSVSEAVLRQAPVPVLLAGPRTQVGPDRYATLIVAVDGSEPAEAAVGVAADLAERLDADLFLVQVLDPRREAPPADVIETSYLARVASRLAPARTSYDVLHARDPARAIVDVARERPDALVVMGTHGRSGVRRMAMGSVALRVVKHASSPVLVVNAAEPTERTDPSSD